jgi:hypothetical protein
MVRVARELGKAVYTSIDEVPPADANYGAHR